MDAVNTNIMGLVLFEQTGEEEKLSNCDTATNNFIKEIKSTQKSR